LVTIYCTNMKVVESSDVKEFGDNQKEFVKERGI
jgi:hypothetical protein